MRRILYLLPDLDYRGHARQASLLAQGMPRDRFEIAVACLSDRAPMAEPLSRSAIPVHCLHRGYRFDFHHWFRLRRLVQDFQPDLIHVWGGDALRTLRFASFLNRTPPIVFSLPPSRVRYRRLGWWERRSIAQAARIVATCESDRTAFMVAGLPSERITLIRPGVVIPKQSTPTELPAGIPSCGPILMVCGHMHTVGRLMDAFWVTEILSYVIAKLQIVVLGDGAYRQRVLDYFRQTSRITNNVHFLGARPDATEFLPFADVLIVPHRQLGGTFATLEAMAAGKPVVAARLPHLETIIRDGETGMLATPADQPALARACLRLFENENQRKAMAAAARNAVANAFSSDTMIANFATLYDEVVRP